MHQVEASAVESALRESGQSSPAFDRWNALRTDSSNWVSLLFEWRNHGAHRQRVPKFVNVSTVRRVDHEFKIPLSGDEQTVYPGLGCQAILERLASDVQELISECRRLDPKLR